MTKKELLEIVVRLQDRVNELEKRLDELEKQPFISDPFRTPELIPAGPPLGEDLCTDGGYHDYEFPWSATTPPSCKKCGKQAETFTITCSGDPFDSVIATSSYCTCDQPPVGHGKESPTCEKCGGKGYCTVNA